MDLSKKKILDKKITKTIENLKKNNMSAYYVADKKECLLKVKEFLKAGDTVSVGGSVSLDEIGALDLLRNGDYNFLDRYKPGITREETQDIYRKSFFSDVYLSSSNAITQNGELYNVDGNSNRVAAILFGPKNVIILAGVNKIVKDINEAVLRVKEIAAPANCTRLNCNTYCMEKGECVAYNNEEIAAGCNSEARICCNYVISAKQRIPDRIKVILVGEELGY